MKENEKFAIIYAPSICFKHVFFLLLIIKVDILNNMVNQTGPRPHDLNGVFSYNGSQWGTSMCLPIFFKISYFVFSRRKECIQAWNNLRGK